MSLVEKALRKLQETQAAPPAVAAALAARAAARVDASAATPALKPVQGVVRASKPAKSIPLNRQALRAAGLLPPEHQEREINDQYRQIKRPLIANALGRKIANGHVIMVASALPGEGKTFNSFNLALSIAREKDVSVLLVDADVPKPHISRLLGVANEPGLLDALMDESQDVESLILGTDVPGLSVLPAGHRTDTATELLASARMQELVTSIGAHDPNRIVLLDSPPLLLTSESRVLSSVVGQVVLVVRAEFTAQQAVLDAISHLGEDKSIGLVLNQSLNAAGSGYYYGGYGDAPKSP